MSHFAVVAIAAQRLADSYRLQPVTFFEDLHAEGARIFQLGACAGPGDDIVGVPRHGEFIHHLPQDVRQGIAGKGIRNNHLIAIAPTGTISLLAGNVSSGLEPIFAAVYRRKILDENGNPEELCLTDYAVQLWRAASANAKGFPPGFVTVDDIPVRAHLDMQAALQPFVDNSISKTINVPEDCPFPEFRKIYDLAYEKGLKGCTTFRPNPVTGAVLMTALQRRIVAFWNGRPTSAALRASDRSEGAEIGPSLLASKFDLPQGSNCWVYLTFEFLIDIGVFATLQVIT